MDQKLYNVAEAAYQHYDKSNDIGGQPLMTWLLAEIHFLGTITEVISVQICEWPKKDLELILAIRSAHVYREIRKEAYRAHQVKLKEATQADRPNEQ
ncbi:hypothetical protein K2P47_03965 [Patescibacteria group bacterium]|nr:hypothetical protein [Patescibacteria group bacterium]